LQTEPERNAGLSRRPLQEQKRPAEAGPICYLRIGIAGLVVRHFGIILCRSLTLLSGFLTAALLLAGLRGRRLILLPGLVLVRHDVSFHGNASTTERHYNHNNGPPFRFVPDKEKPGSQCRNYVSLTYSVLPLVIHVFSRRRRVVRRSLQCDTASNASSSAIMIRTHNHRPTNKREHLFRSNHSRRALLIPC